MLRQNDVRFTSAGTVSIVGIGAVDQKAQVAVLFQISAFAKVGQLRHLVDSLLRPTVELADRDHRDIEFLGQKFEIAGDFTHLGLA